MAYLSSLVIIAVLLGATACGASAPTPAAELPEEQPPSKEQETPAVELSEERPLSKEQVLQKAQDFHTVCLEVEQSFSYGGEQVSLDVYGTVQGILEGLGSRVVSAEDQCDASVTMTLAGSHGEKMLNVVDVRTQKVVAICPAEVTTTGEMAISLPGHHPLVLAMQAAGEWSKTCPEGHEEAYKTAWTPVLDLLSEVWGHRVYIQALESDTAHVPSNAQGALIVMGPEAAPLLGEVISKHRDPLVLDLAREALLIMSIIGPGDATGAVPYLIEALETNNVRAASPASLLEQITGQDFGDDATAWKKWWDEQ